MFSAEISPLLPWWALATIFILAVSSLVHGFVRATPGIWFRLLFLGIAIVALLNPMVTKHERTTLSDVVAILVDESGSQKVSNRLERARAVSEEVREALSVEKDLDIRLNTIADAIDRDGTYISESLSKVFSDVPINRIAGAFIITDGQIHDTPNDFSGITYPLHFLLVGESDQYDRHLAIEKAPTYVIVGEEAMFHVRVDGDVDVGAETVVHVRVNGEKISEHPAVVGETLELPILVESEGLSAIELEIEGGGQELTLQNNKVLLTVNGVRSRLSVMMVSGAPGPGLRSVRNLLKADPAVDLVHFTVLRPPNKQDLTPVDELSLIPFPSEELFSVRLREFDLIIFDRYHRRGIFPTAYLKNITDYVLDGGAVFDIAGTSFASPLSLAASPLGKILPAHPTGRVLESAFVPTLSDRGARHPVTAHLEEVQDSGGQDPWGRWFRLFDSETDSGEVLLTGSDNRPLLVLDRVGEGRVAQLLSDHSWLWARGYEGGGPQQALMRRLVHWLMKQPDLEENALTARVEGQRLTVIRRSLEEIVGPVTVVGPDNQSETIQLTTETSGVASGFMDVENFGIYRLRHGDQETVAIVGETQIQEVTEVRAIDYLVGPLAQRTGGSSVWVRSVGVPPVVRGKEAEIKELDDAMGILRHKRHQVSGSVQTALFPASLLLMLLLGSAMLVWRIEGR